MALKRRREIRPEPERLEGRLQLSAAIPANSIGTSLGSGERAWSGHGSFRRRGAHELDGRQVVDSLRHFRSARSGKFGRAQDCRRGRKQRAGSAPQAGPSVCGRTRFGAGDAPSSR